MRRISTLAGSTRRILEGIDGVNTRVDSDGHATREGGSLLLGTSQDGVVVTDAQAEGDGTVSITWKPNGAPGVVGRTPKLVD